MAITAELRRRKESIDYNDLLAVPLCFIFKLSAELAPARVLYGLGELMVFYHILWSSVFNTDDVVFFEQLRRELMEHILALV